MSLGEMIRSKREAQNMTQQELADALYVTRQTVSRWESGSRCPDLILAKKLADTFDISLDEMVSGCDAASYIPRKRAASDLRKILAAIFMLVLSVWFMVYAHAANGTAFAVISMILAFIACFIFVFSYFGDLVTEN